MMTDWPIGIKASKFANSTIEKCVFYHCAQGLQIGGNCNAVTVLNCQFNLDVTVGGYGIYGTGGGIVNFIGCEYGNGGSLFGFAPGESGANWTFQKIAVETQELSSVVTSNNQVEINGYTLKPGIYTNTPPFRVMNGGVLSISNDLASAGVRQTVTGTVTLTIASPCVITKTAHGFAVNDRVQITTTPTGALPSGLTAGNDYFVQSVTTDTFTVSSTKGGAAINTTGSQSGTHTVTRPMLPLVECTTSSYVSRLRPQQTGGAGNPIEVYTSEAFTTLSHVFGSSPSHNRLNSGTLNIGESYRGAYQWRFNPNSSGVNGADVLEVGVKANGFLEWSPINNSASRITVGTAATSYQLVRNTRVNASHTASQTLTLPIYQESGIDDEIEIICTGTGGVVVAQNASQFIRQGASVSTTGVTGTLTLVQGDIVRLKCFSRSSTQGWIVIGGNFNGTVL